MSEDRFNRLETKVDKLDDKIDRVNIEVSEMRVETKHQMEVIRSHIASDNRIIDHIQPLLPVLTELTDIVEDHKYRKKVKEDRVNKLKDMSLKIGVFIGLTTTLGILIKYGKHIGRLFL